MKYLNYMFLGVIVFFSIKSTAQSINYNAMMEKVQQIQRTATLESDSTLLSWISSQNTNGSWTGFVYGNIPTAVNHDNKHLVRLWQLSIRCTDTSSVYYNDSTFKYAVKNGLDFWFNSNSTHGNWWFNMIYYPQKMGQILIMMREFPGYIPTTQVAGIDELDIISLFTPTAISGLAYNGLGANMLDISLHYYFRGMLTEDSTLLAQTTDFLMQNMGVQVQVDLSFHDHNEQLHLSSYAWVYCNVFTKVAFYLSASAFEFDNNNPKVKKVLDFIKHTQIPVVRGKYWDFSVVGRGVSRKDATRSGPSYLPLLASDVDTPSAAIYNDAIDRVTLVQPSNYNVQEFNKHFWVSDYTVHSKADYLFAVRNVSERTVESEEGNTENLNANYFSYGATFIGVNGNEYFNIMPLWHWAMIPGITAKYSNTFPARTQWGFNYGNTKFVGGLSDSKHGLSVLDMDKDGVKAKKSWFFFDDEIVCLGADVFSTSGYSIRTTLNQSWADGDVYYSDDGIAEYNISVGTGVNDLTDAKWIRHDSIAYFLPVQNIDVSLTHQNKSGSWYDINNLQSNASVSGDVFTLWMDHGVFPNNVTYAYIVVPNITSLAQAQSYDTTNIHIAINSDSLQLVYHAGLDLYQMVFYSGSTANYNNVSFSADKPCVMMLDGDTLAIADPTQDLSQVDVSISRNGITYYGSIQLPSGNSMEGSTMLININSLQSTSIEHPLQNDNRKLIDVYDLMGRKVEATPKNAFLLFKYDDGSVEKKIVIE